MKLALVGGVAALALGLAACGSDADTNNASKSSAPSAATSAKPAPSAAASSSGAPAASGSAGTASGGDDVCKKKNLTAGGTGAYEDPCKYSGEILKAKFKSFGDDGTVFEIENPWPEKVNVLSAWVYYYDKAGKQLAVKDGGSEKKADFVNGVDVSIDGNKTSEVKIGWSKKEMPKGADTAEVVITSFGWDLGQGKGSYFTNTDKTTADRPKGGGAAGTDKPAEPSKGGK